ncbi:hypothetical protein COCMIDRAFT_86347 [Bipolaris oryzae ATCC 44560]|uniref:Uncharacterized protein n=1 Tax=Bipolaris oryzae ATCC 44560 TaxID=930090 RepID=W6ZAM2_COCMI|nr:uncharacterized protein COCMIDRAFT_86347 [Bipolaris oryzae ATCC 44560]EUC48792.1 hypothetical protein COCMIDRAFT_86347 [Bipolaris oryzae ATCC 44560]
MTARSIEQHQICLTKDNYQQPRHTATSCATKSCCTTCPDSCHLGNTKPILKPRLRDIISLFDLPINKLSVLSIARPIGFPARRYIPGSTRTTSLGTPLTLASACVTRYAT